MCAIMQKLRVCSATMGAALCGSVAQVSNSLVKVSSGRELALFGFATLRIATQLRRCRKDKPLRLALAHLILLIPRHSARDSTNMTELAAPCLWLRESLSWF